MKPDMHSIFRAEDDPRTMSAETDAWLKSQQPANPPMKTPIPTTPDAREAARIASQDAATRHDERHAAADRFGSRAEQLDAYEAACREFGLKPGQTIAVVLPGCPPVNLPVRGVFQDPTTRLLTVADDLHPGYGATHDEEATPYRAEAGAATPAPSAVGEGWRELGPDEVVQVGDEWSWPDAGRWIPEKVPGATVGRTRVMLHDDEIRYRRRVAPPAAFSTETAAGLGMPHVAGAVAGVDLAAQAAKLPEDEPHTIIGQGSTARHLHD